MSDGAPKAEEASDQRIEMDRVDVARNSGVTATDISRYPPYRGGRRGRVLAPKFGRVPPPRLAGEGGVGLAAEVGTRFGPDAITFDCCLGEHVELPAAGMLPQVRSRNPEGKALVGTERALLTDPIRDVDEAGQREGEGSIDHDADGERKGEHVRVGRWQDVGVAESADVRVARQLIAIDRRLRQFEREVGQPVTVPAAGSRDRLRVEPRKPGSLLEARQRHAPRMLWPQTRMIWPLTPAVPSRPSQATVSATSTGRPPWLRLLIRRPISRVANGIAFVMAVSMKPGATALIVMSRLAIAGASAWTMPMIPALLAA